MWATALTFLKNFKVPCLYVALAAALCTAGATTWATRAIMLGQVEAAKRETVEARKEFSDFKAAQASQAADAYREGYALAAGQVEAVRALGDAIVAKIDSGVASIKAAVADRSDQFRSATNASDYACLDLALPGVALRLYERPGGSALTPGNDPGP
jgi:hypothetical protein